MEVVAVNRAAVKLRSGLRQTCDKNTHKEVDEWQQMNSVAAATRNKC